MSEGGEGGGEGGNGDGDLRCVVGGRGGWPPLGCRRRLPRIFIESVKIQPTGLFGSRVRRATRVTTFGRRTWSLSAFTNLLFKTHL